MIHVAVNDLPVKSQSIAGNNVDGVWNGAITEDIAANVGAGDILDGRVGVSPGRRAVERRYPDTIDGALILTIQEDSIDVGVGRGKVNLGRR